MKAVVRYDVHAQHIADVHEYDLNYQAGQKQRVAVGYNSVIATITALIVSLQVCQPLTIGGDYRVLRRQRDSGLIDIDHLCRILGI